MDFNEIKHLEKKLNVFTSLEQLDAWCKRHNIPFISGEDDMGGDKYILQQCYEKGKNVIIKIRVRGEIVHTYLLLPIDFAEKILVLGMP